MIRAASSAFLLLFMVCSVHGADEAKGEKVEFANYSDYFVKNDSGLKDDTSYLVFTDKKSFDKIFSLRPPLIGKKSVAMPDDTFEKKIVISKIQRGNAITTFAIDKVTVDGDQLYIQYQAKTGKASTATFASPMIVAAERGKVKKVVFIENEKTVSTLEVK